MKILKNNHPILSKGRRFADFSLNGKMTKNPHQINQRGAAAVEFAFALLALCFFFAIYMQFIQIFIVHERLMFTGFTASRTHAVRGETRARQAAGGIDAEANLVFDAKKIHLRRDIPVPLKLRDIFSGGSGKFTVSHHSPFFDELDLMDKLKGDN